jgi:hypothetical protein
MASPPKMYQKFINQVSKDSTCKNINTFPEITFVIDEKEYTLNPKDYIIDEDYFDDQEVTIG